MSGSVSTVPDRPEGRSNFGVRVKVRSEDLILSPLREWVACYVQCDGVDLLNYFQRSRTAEEAVVVRLYLIAIRAHVVGWSLGDG